jgi:hypothetical protein
MRARFPQTVAALIFGVLIPGALHAQWSSGSSGAIYDNSHLSNSISLAVTFGTSGAVFSAAANSNRDVRLAARAHHIQHQYSGAAVSTVVDTPAVGNVVSDTSDTFRIGANSSMSRAFAGVIDEVRVSNVMRSAAWIATEYNNQSSPSTFFTLGGP